jgi:hypothetical protein
MHPKKNILTKMLRGMLLTVSVFALFALLTHCKKDPVQGWTFFVEPPPPPEITDLTSIIKNCEPPYPVTYKATINNVIGTMNYFWDFGDGATSTDLTPTHIYTTKGSYKVKLRVSNSIGSDTSSIYMTELNQSSLPVTAKYEYLHYNNNNFAPNKIIFTNKSTGANLFYWWFGDGNENNNAEPEHVFNSSGTYTVKMRSTCTNGSYNEYSQQVYINPAPQRIFIDAINLMLPSNHKGNSIFIDIYHNMTLIGSTITVSPSSYPIKFVRPNDFTDGGAYFDYVQYTSNEVFKFLIYRYVPDNPPVFLYEILLSSVDIRNNFYPTAYFQVETLPYVKDVFVDIYFSY